MNTVELKVTLTFSGEVPPEQVANITENTMQALSLHVEHSECGLAGDEFEEFTVAIEVSSDALTQNWDVESGRIQTV